MHDSRHPRLEISTSPRRVISTKTTTAKTKVTRYTLYVMAYKRKEEDVSCRTWQEILPGAWCVESLLQPEECQRLQQAAFDAGILAKDWTGDLRHRQRVQVTIQDQELSDKAWNERILPNIPQEIVVSEEDETIIGMQHRFFLNPKECIGRWTPSRMHSSWNVAYCSGRGHLAAHRDGNVVMSEHERSFLTINGYLTDRPLRCGGATRFLKDDIAVCKDNQEDIFNVTEEDVLHRVEADHAGKAVIFFHNLLHDGEPLNEGSSPKWVYRSLIYYKRDPESAPKLTTTEVHARKLIKEAEEAEQSGLIDKAISLYKAAYRLDPSLDR